MSERLRITFRYALGETVLYHDQRWQVVTQRWQRGIVSTFHKYGLQLVADPATAPCFTDAYEPDIHRVVEEP